MDKRKTKKKCILPPTKEDIFGTVNDARYSYRKSHLYIYVEICVFLNECNSRVLAAFFVCVCVFSTSFGEAVSSCCCLAHVQHLRCNTFLRALGLHRLMFYLGKTNRNAQGQPDFLARMRIMSPAE